MTPRLNDKQLTVLQWIADGCPPEIMTGTTHKISAAALRSRDLVRISGTGSRWRAEITEAGCAYLASPPAAIRPRQRASQPPAAAARHPAEQPRRAPPPARDRIPDNLRGAHPLLRATRSAARGQRAQPDGRLHIGPRDGLIYTVVSRAQLHRALLIAHGLIHGALRRGHKIEAHPKSPYGDRAGVAIVIRGHRYPVELREETRTLPPSEKEIGDWRRQHRWLVDIATRTEPPPQLRRKEPTGRVQLVLPNGYAGGRATWIDSPRSLNGYLDRVLDALEQRAIGDDARAAEAERRRQEHERETALREENARLARIENARATRALAEAKAWRDARELNAYAEALRAVLSQLESAEAERIASWCDWIEDRARRSDPTHSTTLVRGFDDQRDGQGW